MNKGGPLYTKNNIHSLDRGHVCIPVWLYGKCGISEELSVFVDCIHNVVYFLEDLQKNISCIRDNMTVY
jgi:hypothetical protein